MRVCSDNANAWDPDCASRQSLDVFLGPGSGSGSGSRGRGTYSHSDLLRLGSPAQLRRANFSTGELPLSRSGSIHRPQKSSSTLDWSRKERSQSLLSINILQRPGCVPDIPLVTLMFLDIMKVSALHARLLVGNV